MSESGPTGTPSSGKVRLYAKADGLLYSKDDAGVETALGGGSIVEGTTPISSADANGVIFNSSGIITTSTNFVYDSAAQSLKLTGKYVGQTYTNASPANGDMWWDGSNWYYREGGVSYLFSASIAFQNSYSDSVFEIYDNADNTKKIAFQASSIATATTRTVTVPNRNLTLDTVTKDTTDTSGMDAGGVLFSASSKVSSASTITYGSSKLTLTKTDAHAALLEGTLTTSGATTNTNAAVSIVHGGTSARPNSGWIAAMKGQVTLGSQPGLNCTGAVGVAGLLNVGLLAVVPAYSSGQGYGIHVKMEGAQTNAGTQYAYFYNGEHSGATAAGFSVQGFWQLADSTGAVATAGQQRVTWIDPTFSSWLSEHQIRATRSSVRIRDISTTQGRLRFGTDTDYYDFVNPTGVTLSWTLPSSNGSTGALLSTDGSGTLSWKFIPQSKSIAVESPTATEDISIFFTPVAITVTEMRAVLIGSATPSVTWTIRHSTDRSATGNEVVTSGTTTTSTTTGSDVTSFNDATIPADSFVWLETTAKSGTVTQLHVTIVYTVD